ncbi:hypothetical protein CVS40_6344 [Lucilia cuprina]|nr:hypothetical protein CVS40_6344 [Lucilia cuprina]
MSDRIIEDLDPEDIWMNTKSFRPEQPLMKLCNNIRIFRRNLLLLIGNKTNAERLISMKNLPGICSIKCEYHSNLNFSKGTIYINKYPRNCKYQRKNPEGNMVPSGVMLLTFDRYITPDKLEISWRKVKVRQFYPDPMRCKNFEMLGHTHKWYKIHLNVLIIHCLNIYQKIVRELYALTVPKNTLLLQKNAKYLDNK